MASLPRGALLVDDLTQRDHDLRKDLELLRKHASSVLAHCSSPFVSLGCKPKLLSAAGSHRPALMHFLKTCCGRAFAGSATLQRGFWSRAGARRSQDKAQALLGRCTSSVERTHCLHPSDRMSSYRTPCPPTDTRLTPTCCATPAACDLFSTVRKLFPLVWILPETKLYDIEAWPIAGKIL